MNRTHHAKQCTRDELRLLRLLLVMVALMIACVYGGGLFGCVSVKASQAAASPTTCLPCLALLQRLRALTHYPHTTTQAQTPIHDDYDDGRAASCERGPVARPGKRRPSFYCTPPQAHPPRGFALLRCHEPFLSLLISRRLFFGRELPGFCAGRDAGLDLGVRPQRHSCGLDRRAAADEHHHPERRLH